MKGTKRDFDPQVKAMIENILKNDPSMTWEKLRAMNKQQFYSYMARLNRALAAKVAQLEAWERVVEAMRMVSGGNEELTVEECADLAKEMPVPAWVRDTLEAAVAGRILMIPGGSKTVH